MINIYNQDCLEAMKLMKDNQFDLAIVDPPYGINVANNSTGTVIRNKSDKDIFKIKDWDKCIPDKNYFLELQRVSKNQIIWGGNYFLDYLGYCKAPIIWNKKNGASLYADGEMAWTSKGLPKNLKIWTHQWCGAFKASERGAIKYHPTQKPIALYEWLLMNYAKEGDKILDTHLGSGSIALACHNLGFDLEGYELDKEYYDNALKRIKNHQAQLRLI
jgi:site-specific DNA-methyltransferase (adenine-specific)|tara:strand:- start:215 stop:865 length:651 start_codon:yes stop_codon:yes gene_type:complete